MLLSIMRPNRFNLLWQRSFCNRIVQLVAEDVMKYRSSLEIQHTVSDPSDRRGLISNCQNDGL